MDTMQCAEPAANNKKSSSAADFTASGALVCAEQDRLFGAAAASKKSSEADTSVAAQQDRLFGATTTEAPGPRYNVPQPLEDGDDVPHGAHPYKRRISAYRSKYAQPSRCTATPGPESVSGMVPPDTREADDTHVKWGMWAPNARWGHSALWPHSGMPPAYIRCMQNVARPSDILCGYKSASTRPTVGGHCDNGASAGPLALDTVTLVCEAVEAMFVQFIELMLVIQLKYIDTRKDYKLISKDSMRRHAACAMLGKGPTDALKQSDYTKFDHLCRAKMAPFEDALREYDRPSLLQFFERELGTLYIFGVPVLSTRVMVTEPGWRQANEFLERVGSKLRVRLCILGNSTELLLGEPILEKCTPTTIVVGSERMRTAMLAFEVASTQDTAENPVKVFRTESTAFIVHHKWDIARIEAREWNPLTYGPTQKLIVALAKRLLAGSTPDATLSAVRKLLEAHCTGSLIEYQMGEELVNKYTFEPKVRGILHALFSRHVCLEDMHSWLVDSVKRLSRGGVLSSIIDTLPNGSDAASRCQIRLLMYTTDTWFSGSRLYTLLMLGAMVASADPSTDAAKEKSASAMRIDTRVLTRAADALFSLAAVALKHIAGCAHRRFLSAQYRVLSHMLDFAHISTILTRQYQRNDGHVDETSLRFNSSFWMNILGYYLRLSDRGIEHFDAEILSCVRAFVDDAMAVLCEHNPAVAAALGKVVPKLAKLRSADISDENLAEYVRAHFDVFCELWNNFVVAAHRAATTVSVHAGEPNAKRARVQ